MKRILSIMLCMLLFVTLLACGDKQTDSDVTQVSPSETETAGSNGTEAGQSAEWTLNGFFLDENEYMLSITWMDDVSEPGWYVGCMLGADGMEDSWGGMLQQEGNMLHGTLPSSGSRDALNVTVSQEGTDGVLLTIEGGKTYHFKPMNLPEATIFVTINVEGRGMIGYEKGDTVPELDPEWPYQSAQVNLAEPETYTIAAAPEAGYEFVKWTKNGVDYAKDPVIKVLFEESADFVAVFEENPDGQHSVMNSDDENRVQDIIEEMVVDYGNYGSEADGQIQVLLKEMKDVDEDAASRWESIMELWKNSNRMQKFHYDEPVSGLSDTDELCFVVLGFQLAPDGTMREELIQRLTVALRCAERYPKSLIVCTGGGTAAEDETATEAGRMAEWLIKHGVKAERVIVEDKSITTAQNAIYTFDILEEKYPRVKELVIVSSDYHIATGTLLFGAEAILRAEKAGTETVKVVSDAAWKAPSGSLSTMFQAGALIELSGDMDTAFEIYYETYDIHELPPLN